jgi:hypothetical protein
MTRWGVMWTIAFALYAASTSTARRVGYHALADRLPSSSCVALYAGRR